MVILATYRGKDSYVPGFGMILEKKEYKLELSTLRDPGEVKVEIHGIKLRRGKEQLPFAYYPSFIAFLKNWTNIRTG